MSYSRGVSGRDGTFQFSEQTTEDWEPLESFDVNARERLDCLRVAFFEDSTYFNRIAPQDADLKTVLSNAHSLTKKKNRIYSPIRVPTTDLTKRVTPSDYRLVAVAIERLWERDCTLITFFEQFSHAQNLPPVAYPNEVRDVPQKANWIREQIRTNCYLLTNLYGEEKEYEKKCLFKRLPIELVDFEMPPNVLRDLFLYPTTWEFRGSDFHMNLDFIQKTWYFELLFALLEKRKFDFLFKKEPSHLLEGRWDKVRLRQKLQKLCEVAVEWKRNDSVRILLQVLDEHDISLRNLIAIANQAKNLEILPLLENRYQKEDSSWFCCSCCDWDSPRRNEEPEINLTDWEKHYAFRDLPSRETTTGEQDRHLVEFFEHYLKANDLFSSSERPASKYREEIAKKNYKLNQTCCESFKGLYPPEVALFRMTPRAFAHIFRASLNREEVLFPLIENGHLEFFTRSPIERDLLKLALSKAIRRNRIPSVEVLLRVLDLSPIERVECRERAKRNPQILALFDERTISSA